MRRLKVQQQRWIRQDPKQERVDFIRTVLIIGQELLVRGERTRAEVRAVHTRTAMIRRPEDRIRHALGNGVSKKGEKWTPIEDAAILGWVSRFGKVQWNKLCQTQLPNRSQAEVRERFELLEGVKEIGRASQWSLALWKQGREIHEQVQGAKDFSPPKLKQKWRCAFCTEVFQDYHECEVILTATLTPSVCA